MPLLVLGFKSPKLKPIANVTGLLYSYGAVPNVSIWDTHAYSTDDSHCCHATRYLGNCCANRRHWHVTRCCSNEDTGRWLVQRDWMSAGQTLTSPGDLSIAPTRYTIERSWCRNRRITKCDVTAPNLRAAAHINTASNRTEQNWREKFHTDQLCFELGNGAYVDALVTFSSVQSWGDWVQTICDDLKMRIGPIEFYSTPTAGRHRVLCILSLVEIFRTYMNLFHCAASWWRTKLNSLTLKMYFHI
jgi:hypothetical protein